MRALGIGIAIVLLAFGAVWLAAASPPGRARDRLPDRGITVEVLNVTRVDGLAKTVTRRLREQGFDVVYYGWISDSVLDSTRVLVRRGGPDAAQVVRSMLGTGTVVEQPDDRLLLDVSVWLGLDAAELVGLHP